MVGAGRSGAVTAACLAELGHTVRAVDVDADRVARLRAGFAPFFEPGLDDLIQRNLQAERLSFTTAYSESVPDAGFVLLSVDTPARNDGDANLSSLTSAIQELAPLLAEDAVVVTRSTVPVGTNASIDETLRGANPQASFFVVSNPEFLREGHAVDDFMRPERVVIGATSEKAAEAVAALYAGIGAPMLLTDLPTAELTKYAANAYLAASITFINEIANISERVGADISLVSRALALDSRIGPRAYLAPGIGFGGSCLPKDLRALIRTAERVDYAPVMLQAITRVNQLQPRWVIRRLQETYEDATGLTVAVFGISFKGDTFDARSSPAVEVIRLLAKEGVHVRAFDPLGDDTAAGVVGPDAELYEDAYAAAEGSDALIVATDHSAFSDLDLERLARSMKSAVLIDGRNHIDRDLAAQAGFTHVGIGHGRRAG